MDRSADRDRLCPPSSPQENLNRTRRPPEQENPNLLRPPSNTSYSFRARRPPTPNDSMAEFQPDANSTKLFNSRYLREASQGECYSPDLSALLNDTSIVPDSPCNLSQVTQPSIFRSGHTPSRHPADVSMMPYAVVNQSQAAALRSYDQSHPAYDYVNDSVSSEQPSAFRSGFTPPRHNVNDSVAPEQPSAFRSGFTPPRLHANESVSSEQPSAFRSGFTPPRHNVNDSVAPEQPSAFRSGFTPPRHNVNDSVAPEQPSVYRSGFTPSRQFNASDLALMELGDTTFDDESETMVIDGPRYGPWKLAVMYAPNKTNDVVSYDLQNMILAELEKRREAAFQNVSAAGYNRFSPTGASSFHNEH